MDTTLAQRIHYERTDTGVDVYLLPTSVRDVVVCRMAFPGGAHSAYDRQAVALLVSALAPWGVRGMKRSAVRETFDALGADVSVSEGSERLFVSLSCRRAVFAEAFALLMRVLAHPQVTTREYGEALSNCDTSLEHAMEDTRGRAGTALMQALYREGHPHWSVTPRDLRRELVTMTKEEVLEFYTRTFSTVGGVVCIAGDLTVKQTLAVVREGVAALPAARPVQVPTVHPDRTGTPAERDLVVSLKDKLNVDTLLAIPLAITREHRDLHALLVGVHILGGSHTSRLFNSLRNKQSLTYGAYASLGGLGDGYAGYLQAQAIFPNDVFTRGRAALREEVAMWAARGITAPEVARRKEELAGKYKVGLSTTRGLCGAIFDTVLSERPLTYLDEYPGIIESLALRDVNRAIKEHIRYDLAVTAAAGSITPTGHPL